MATTRQVILQLRADFQGAGLDAAARSADSLQAGMARLDAALGGMDASGLRALRSTSDLALAQGRAAEQATRYASALSGVERAQAALSATGGRTVANERAYSTALAQSATAVRAYESEIRRLNAATEANLRLQEAGGGGGIGSSIGGVLKNPTNALFSGPGLAVAGGAYLAAKAFDYYSQTQQNISTGVAASSGNPADIAVQNAGIEKLSGVFQGFFSRLELSTAIYPALSAGFVGQQGVDILAQGARYAQASGTDPKTAVEAITNTLAAFAQPTAQAANVAQYLYGATRAGKAEPGEFAKDTATFASSSRAAGFGVQSSLDLFGQLTKVGVPVQQAAQDINALNTALLKMSPAARAIFSSIGVDTSQAGLAKGGYEQFFRQVNQATGGDGELLAKLFPNQRALKVALNATGGLYQSYLDTVAQANDPKATIASGQKIVQSTPGLDVRDEIKKFWDDFQTGLGGAITKLDPQIKTVIGKLKDFGDALGKLGDAADKNKVGDYVGGASYTFGEILKQVIAGKPIDVNAAREAAAKDLARFNAQPQDAHGNLIVPARDRNGNLIPTGQPSAPYAAFPAEPGSGAGPYIPSIGKYTPGAGVVPPPPPLSLADTPQIRAERGDNPSSPATVARAAQAKAQDDWAKRQAAATADAESLTRQQHTTDVLAAAGLRKAAVSNTTAGLNTALLEGDTRAAHTALGKYIDAVNASDALKDVKTQEIARMRALVTALDKQVALRNNTADQTSAGTALSQAERTGGVPAITAAAARVRDLALNAARLRDVLPSGKEDVKTYTADAGAINDQYNTVVKGAIAAAKSAADAAKAKAKADHLAAATAQQSDDQDRLDLAIGSRKVDATRKAADALERDIAASNLSAAAKAKERAAVEASVAGLTASIAAEKANKLAKEHAAQQTTLGLQLTGAGLSLSEAVTRKDVPGQIAALEQERRLQLRQAAITYGTSPGDLRQADSNINRSINDQEAAARAITKALLSPRTAATFGPGQLDPGIEAGRGNANFRLGLFKTDSRNEEIAILRRQIEYDQQQIAELRQTNAKLNVLIAQGAHGAATPGSASVSRHRGLAAGNH